MVTVGSPEFARRARHGLIILTFINLLNYLDRYVVSALIESLKKSELGISDAQAGLLMTGFLVVYMCASPFFGIWGDRVSRPKLLALGIFLWSLSTFFAGFSRSFVGLFACRALVGVGEAAYATIAPALLADYFPSSMRGRVFSIFYMAIPVGSAMGYVTGGLVDSHFGWRAAFYVAGFPGILLALLAIGLFDPPRGIQEAEQSQPASNKTPVIQILQTPSSFSNYLLLMKNQKFLWIVAGLAAYTFAIGGLAFWMPTFLERVRGLPKSQATVSFGSIVIVTGFFGTFLGGFLGDYFLKKTKEAYLYLSGITMILATPLVYVALTSTHPTTYLTALVGALLLAFMSTGPVNSAIADVVSPAMRACAFAAATLLIHTFGDVPSPSLIGAISDRTSLSGAVMIVPGFILASGILWTIAAKVRSN